HRTDPYEPAPDHGDAPPNPYDELAALDDGPLEVTSLEDFFDEDATGRDGPEEDEREPEWAPPVHRRGGRRRRGRRTGLPRAVKAVAGVAVLACLVTLADRWAVLYAEHRTADVLEDRLDLAAAPEVEIGGFPFLTQLADRRLDSVRVTVPDVAADRVSLAKVSATAHDVRLEGEGLTSVGGARVPRLDGDVLLSFADLNRELGASQVTFTGEGRDRVRARGTLPVAGRELRLRAEATIRRDGERGIATRIGAMRLDIGDVATYRPGTGASDGLHLTPRAAADLSRETRRAKALLSVPAIAKRLGLSDAAARAALGDDGELAELTGSPGFAREARNLNLVDLALDHPAVLRALGLDPGLLDALSRLTRPVLADRLSLSFALPEPERGSMRLRDVRVEEDGIRVRLSGSELAVGGS
ncbi:LmeA family phospholipid-binding protein, partial [Streptomyces scabiei]